MRNAITGTNNFHQIPEEVGFINISFTTISDVIKELSKVKTAPKIAISGMDAMSVDLYNRLRNLLPSAELIKADNIMDILLQMSGPMLQVRKELASSLSL